MITDSEIFTSSKNIELVSIYKHIKELNIQLQGLFEYYDTESQTGIEILKKEVIELESKIDETKVFYVELSLLNEAEAKIETLDVTMDDNVQSIGEKSIKWVLKMFC
ncbi:hypothetical protein HZS_5327 [Henneguya salminicola]|nr:hypothetical protein HZS_5327 [Henneguya salminicola]